MRLIKLTTLFTVSALVLVGCLKEKSTNFANESSPSPNTVDFNNQLESAALDILPTPVIYTFYAELNSSDKTYPAGTVTILKSPSVLEDYYQEDTVNHTRYTFLPDSAYQLLNITATIDPVTHLAAFQLRIFSSKIDLSGAFAVGYTISAVSNGAKIASNKKTILITVGAKNKYDGTYDITWTNYHPTLNPGYTGASNVIEMHTTGANSCKMYFPAASGYAAPAILSGALSAFGSQEPEYTVNPATNAVTVQNSFVGAVTFYAMAPGFNSRYDPATKTFYVKWGYGSGGPYPPFDPGTSREWIQTFKYTGPR